MYLSSLIGITSRTALDIDLYLNKVKFELLKILLMLNEVCEFNINDGVFLKLINIEKIRKNNVYGGYRIKILGILSNIKQYFNIDISTGDPIVPNSKTYKYKCLLSGEVLNLNVYSLETIISEKLETILSKSLNNTRCKDFYDLYINYKTQYNNIDFNILKKSFIETCSYRRLKINKDVFLSIIKEIECKSKIKDNWEKYCNKVDYIKDTPFSLVIETIIKLVNII